MKLKSSMLKKRWQLLLLAFLISPSIMAQDDEGPSSVTGEPVMVTSQIDVMLTQHWSMPTLLNPAATGEIDYVRVRGGARLDWLGSRESPKNFLITADSPFKLMGKRIGAGIIVNSGSYDLYRNLLIGAQGSYKLQFKKSTLSVGLQIGYYRSKFKGSELRLSDLGGSNDSDNSEDGEKNEDEEKPNSGKYDEDMPTHDVAGGAFDIGLGVRFDHPRFYVSLSGLHLTNSKIRMSTEGESTNDSRYIQSKLPRTLYFESGGNIPIHNTLITLQPSLIVGTDFSDFSGVAEMRATYNNLVTFGVDYRYNRAAGVIAGLFLKNFFIGYSWEYDYSASPKGSTGNHELVLGYQFKLDMGGKNLFSHRSIRIM